MTTYYSYTPGPYSIPQLHQEITAAGLPEPSHINGSGYNEPGSPATRVDIGYETPLTLPERDKLNAVIAAHVPLGRFVRRPLYRILYDVQALTSSQFDNVWADLSAPAPPDAPHKYLSDESTNAGAILAMHWSAQSSGVSGEALKNAQQTLITLYVQDNPEYLVSPPFDSSINIPGEEQEQ